MAKKNPNPPIEIDWKKVNRIVTDSMGVLEFCKAYGIGKNVYYRWRKQYPEFTKLAEKIRQKEKGRKAWDPPLEQITRLAAMGLNKSQVAAQLNVAISVYMEHQRTNPKIVEAFEKGQDMGVATIKSVLYNMAASKNLPAVLAFLKRHDHETEEMPTKIVTEVIYTDQSSTGETDEEEY